MFNYNTSKPKEPIKKIFSYQILYFIFSLLTILFIVNEIFVYDYAIQSLIRKGVSDLNPYKNSLYLILSLISRISIPLGSFLVFLSVRKLGLKYLIRLTFPVIFIEIVYDLYSFDKFFEMQFQSPAFIILLGGFYTFIWLKSNNFIVKTLISLLFLYGSIYIGVENGVVIAILFIILNIFEPNRLSQSLFSFVALIPGASQALTGVFYYFYDEYFNRRRYNYFLNYIFPFIAFLVWRLRLLILV